jgi:hypothetical protein
MDLIPSTAGILESTNRISDYQLAYFRAEKLREIDVLAQKIAQVKAKLAKRGGGEELMNQESRKVGKGSVPNEECRKKCFGEIGAILALGQIERSTHRRGQVRECRKYYCLRCNAWHLTKKMKAG